MRALLSAPAPDRALSNDGVTTRGGVFAGGWTHTAMSPTRHRLAYVFHSERPSESVGAERLRPARFV